MNYGAFILIYMSLVFITSYIIEKLFNKNNDQLVEITAVTTFAMSVILFLSWFVAKGLSFQ